MLHDHLANRGGRNLVAVLLNKFVDHLINGFFDRLATDRTLLTGLVETADKLAAIKRLIAPIALQHPEVVALNFLISGEAMLAGNTLAPPANHGFIFNGSRIDHFIVARLTFWAAHLPIVVTTP